MNFIRNLPSKLYYSVLPNYVYLDLTRVFEFFLDALGDVPGELVHREVGNLAGVHEDAYLAPRRDGVHLLHAREGSSEALEVAEALKIAVDGVPPCSRAATGYRICHLDDDRFGRFI